MLQNLFKFIEFNLLLFIYLLKLKNSLKLI